MVLFMQSSFRGETKMASQGLIGLKLALHLYRCRVDVSVSGLAAHVDAGLLSVLCVLLHCISDGGGPRSPR